MTWEKGRQLAFLLKDDLSVQFKYNNSGIRTKKIVNGVETEYFYVGDTLVSQKTGDEVINFAYTAGGAPLGFTYNGTPYYYMLNLQGDIEKIYDTDGNIVVTYFYDAWGKLISIEGELANTIGVKNPLRYRGYYYDTETGFYYLQSRYYDPEICRFINADSLLIAGNDYIQGANMFVYCYNNPVMYVDPSGYSIERTVANLGIFFGGLVYIENIYGEEKTLELVEKYIVPIFNDLEAIRTGIIKLVIGVELSNFLGNLSESGQKIDEFLGLTGIDFGSAGDAFSRLTSVFEIASVAFDPSSSTTDIFNTILSEATGLLGGAVASAAGGLVTSYLIASGGTGAIPILAGVATTFFAGKFIDYLIETV